MAFSIEERNVLAGAKLPDDKIQALEGKDYDSLRSLRNKDMAWWKTQFSDLSEGRIDGLVEAIKDATAAKAVGSVTVAPPPQPAAQSSDSQLSAVLSAMIPVESMDLGPVLNGLKTRPNDVRYYKRATELLSLQDNTPMQVLVVDSNRLDMSGVRIDDSVDCAGFCQMRGLAAPAGRWPCKDGQDRVTITLDDAMMIAVIISCFPTKDGKQRGGVIFKALTDMGGKLLGPGNVDYKPLYDTNWAVMLRFAHIPEADALYGSGVGRQLLPENEGYGKMVKEIVAGIKSGAVPDDYKELVDAFERAKKAHPGLVAQAQAALMGSNADTKKANQERLANLKAQAAAQGAGPVPGLTFPRG